MKKSTLIIGLLLLSSLVSAQCLKLAKLTPIFTKNFLAQDKYLTKMGYLLNKASYEPATFGWDWKNASNKQTINVKMQGSDVYTVQFRLMNNATCFNSLLKEAVKNGFVKDYQKKTSSTTYNYYKNSKYGLETAEWTSDGKPYYQFNLGNLKYFNEIEHQWDAY